MRRQLAVAVAVVLATLGLAAPSPSMAATEQVLFFDDFTGDHIDTAKWFPGLNQHSIDNNGVVPENLSVHAIDDHGTSVSVLDAQANGDRYRGPVRGVRPTGGYPVGDPRGYRRVLTGARTGGLVWTNQRFGAGRYEVRMKALPQSGGCSCMWNYYDSTDPVLPQPSAGGSYIEIDIELPANGHSRPPDWAHWAGFNAFTAPDDAHAGYHNVDVGNQHTGEFHIYRFDWYDGTNGPKRVEFYIDGVLRATDTAHVAISPAQLWVGNWPAPWSGAFDYDSQHMYIDWVKISTLPGEPIPR